MYSIDSILLVALRKAGNVGRIEDVRTDGACVSLTLPSTAEAHKLGSAMVAAGDTVRAHVLWDVTPHVGYTARLTAWLADVEESCAEKTC